MSNKKRIRILKCLTFFDRRVNRTDHKLYKVSFKLRRHNRFIQIFVTRDVSLLGTQEIVDDNLVFLGSRENVFGVFVPDFRFCETIAEKAIELVLREIDVLKTWPRFHWKTGLCEKVVVDDESDLLLEILSNFSPK
jgi:hypothetical protein